MNITNNSGVSNPAPPESAESTREGFAEGPRIFERLIVQTKIPLHFINRRGILFAFSKPLHYLHPEIVVLQVFETPFDQLPEMRG